MGLKDEDWRKDSLVRYRRARRLLARLTRMRGVDVTYFIDEITDVLLDLKQAVIDVDPAGAWKAMLELDVLQAALKRHLKDGNQ
jgi:hypothetical protein